jgi:hypothetical protein
MDSQAQVRAVMQTVPQSSGGTERQVEELYKDFSSMCGTMNYIQTTQEKNSSKTSVFLCN